MKARMIGVRLLAGTGAIVGTLALLALVVAVAGHSPTRALEALWSGAFGSPDAFASATLVRAIPLVLAGLGVALAFRGGVLNIGAEGQLLVGAACASAVALALPSLGVALLPLCVVVGGLGGTAWAAIPAWLRLKRGVLEVISTLMLNSLAVHLVGWLVRGPLQEPTGVYPQTSPIAPGARLPILVDGTRLHAGLLLALVFAGVVWWYMTRTAAGFRLSAVGANPHAAASAGEIRVGRTIAWAFVASGALAGIAGAVEVQGVTYALYESLSPGYGYTAIAVALLARLDARLVVLTAVFFAALEAGGAAMQRDAAIPSALVKVVEALVILAMLAADGLRQRRAVVAPSAA